MSHYRYFICILLVFVFIPSNSFAGNSPEITVGQCCKEGIKIHPNETVMCRTVRVTWVAEGGIDTRKVDWGYLRLDAAREEVSDQTVPLVRRQSFSSDLYLDEVVFHIEDIRSPQDKGPEVAINYSYQPRLQQFGPKPKKDVGIVVSAIEPVTLNEWKLEVSAIPGDSSQSLLTAMDTINKITKTIPLIRGTEEKIGRFHLKIHTICQETHFTELFINADPDLTIQGGNTYVPDGISINDGETLRAFLDWMSKQYGFEVEWVEYPGHPESVEYMKNLSHPGTNQYDEGNAVLSYQITTLTNTDEWQLPDGRTKGSSIFSLSWPDAKHLRVETVGYDKILIEAEEKQRREDKKAKLKEEWERDYKQEIMVYSLKKITPVTAKGFIDPCLSGFVYSLGAIRQYGNPDDITATNRNNAGTGNWIVEKCVADDKANAVIVTAIPATHKKIEELLAKMEGMVTEGSAKGQVKQYPLEVFLLRGTQQGAISSPPTDEPPRTQTAQPVQSATQGEFKGLNTPIVDVSFPDQRLIEVADLLSTLGGISINVAGDVNPRLRITYFVKTEKTIRQILDELGDLYELNIDYRPDGVFIRSREERAPVWHPMVNLSELGISKEDLEFFGPKTSAQLLGRGAVTLIGQPGEEGKTLVALTPVYACKIEFLDVREPYLILKGSLVDVSQGYEPAKKLLENTLYLEAGKPSLLGLTNLREALILLVKWREE